MSGVQFRPVQSPERLADVVYEAIRESIVDKTLPLDVRVDETAIAQQLGVRKTPVREALLSPCRIGVIEPDGLRRLGGPPFRGA